MKKRNCKYVSLDSSVVQTIFLESERFEKLKHIIKSKSLIVLICSEVIAELLNETNDKNNLEEIFKKMNNLYKQKKLFAIKELHKIIEWENKRFGKKMKLSLIDKRSTREKFKYILTNISSPNFFSNYLKEYNEKYLNIEFTRKMDRDAKLNFKNLCSDKITNCEAFNRIHPIPSEFFDKYRWSLESYRNKEIVLEEALSKSYLHINTIYLSVFIHFNCAANLLSFDKYERPIIYKNKNIKNNHVDARIAASSARCDYFICEDNRMNAICHYISSIPILKKFVCKQKTLDDFFYN